MIIVAVVLYGNQRFIPTCVGAQTVTTIMKVIGTALRKTWFLHSTKCTHLPIISIIIGLNLIMHLRTYMGGRMGPRVIRGYWVLGIGCPQRHWGPHGKMCVGGRGGSRGPTGWANGRPRGPTPLAKGPGTTRRFFCGWGVQPFSPCRARPCPPPLVGSLREQVQTWAGPGGPGRCRLCPRGIGVVLAVLVAARWHWRAGGRRHSRGVP